MSADTTLITMKQPTHSQITVRIYSDRKQTRLVCQAKVWKTNNTHEDGSRQEWLTASCW